MFLRTCPKEKRKCGKDDPDKPPTPDPLLPTPKCPPKVQVRYELKSVKERIEKKKLRIRESEKDASSTTKMYKKELKVLQKRKKFLRKCPQPNRPDPPIPNIPMICPRGEDIKTLIART